MASPWALAVQKWRPAGHEDAAVMQRVLDDGFLRMAGASDIYTS